MSISTPETTVEITMGRGKTFPSILRDMTQAWSSVIAILNIKFLRLSFT